MTPEPAPLPRLIFANRFYAPDHSATAQMLTDVAEGLAARGWNVTALTSRLSYDDPAASYPPEEIRDGVQVQRIATTRFGRSNLVGRAADYLSFYAASFFRLLKIARKGDIVIIKTDPPLLSVPLGFAARLKGAKRINWLQDIFPETAAELGVGFAKGPAGKVLAAIRNHSLKQADLNVVIGPRMGERVRNTGANPSRITEIQNFCDDEAIRPVPPDQNPLRAAWGYTDNDFVVGYSGNLGRAHDLDTFLGAAEHLRDQPDIKFLFIGGGHLRRQLDDEARKRNLTSIHTRPYQPRDQLSLSLSVPDLHWVSLQPRLEGLILPSKLYGIAAAGRPLIMVGDPDGDIARMVRKHDFGAAVMIGDVSTFAELICRFRSDRACLDQCGQNARLFLRSGSGRAGTIERWHTTLTRLRDC